MKSSNLKVYLFIITIFIALGTYFLISNNLEKKYSSSENRPDFYQIPEKIEDLNTYISYDMTEQQVGNLYFNSFLTTSINDIENTYTHIENKDIFPNSNFLKSFISQVTNRFTSIPTIENFSAQKKDDWREYYITDDYGNQYTFKVTSVLQYTVSIKKS